MGLVDCGLGFVRQPRVDLGGHTTGDDAENANAELDGQSVDGAADDRFGVFTNLLA